MKIDHTQALHFLTDGIAAHLSSVLDGATVLKACAGMIWVHYQGSQIGTVNVVPDLNGVTLRIMSAGTDPEKLACWIEAAGLDVTMAEAV